MKKIKIYYGQPYPLGAFVRDGGINFSLVNDTNDECGIVFYKKGVEQKERIFIDPGHRVGNICCVFVEGIAPGDYEYNFFIGDRVFVDPYAKRIVGNEKWRSGELARPVLRGGFGSSGAFDWGGTAMPHIPYHESIMYCLNVRSYTRHASSKVRKKGTFAGLMEKLPYLKELGVNAVELMPAYEFEECEWESREEISRRHTIEYQVGHIDEAPVSDTEPPKAKGINCWGYKEAYYFAPKASYSAGGDPCDEMKCMVRAFHKEGIEIIMQFYFPDSVKPGYILEIIKYWAMEYRIDGVHLKGMRLPITLIATEPLLAATKIMCEDFYLHEIYKDSERPSRKILGYYRDEFMYDMRRFLKGDQGMLDSFQRHMRSFNHKCGVVNYITNYYGFTLNDLVSYNEKHNEPNGENNADGMEQNFSWNCGVEGPTRKAAIRDLRCRQMKNALTFLFMAQGTPLLFAGDEFGNSQNGNNNCYCQDNETGWVDWRGLVRNSGLFEYVKELIAFRKKHGILRLDSRFSMLDRYGYGYPDVSYHGEEAWKIQLNGQNSHIGIMYCGKNNNDDEGDRIYIACNMHWEPHRFALPSIANYEWVPVMGTEENSVTSGEDKNVEYIDIGARSISILTGRKLPQKAKEKAKGRKVKKDI